MLFRETIIDGAQVKVNELHFITNQAAEDHADKIFFQHQDAASMNCVFNSIGVITIYLAPSRKRKGLFANTRSAAQSFIYKLEPVK